jgi:hypothetical protein
MLYRSFPPIADNFPVRGKDSSAWAKARTGGLRVESSSTGFTFLGLSLYLLLSFQTSLLRDYHD